MLFPTVQEENYVQDWSCLTMVRYHRIVVEQTRVVLEMNVREFFLSVRADNTFRSFWNQKNEKSAHNIQAYASEIWQRLVLKLYSQLFSIESPTKNNFQSICLPLPMAHTCDVDSRLNLLGRLLGVRYWWWLNSVSSSSMLVDLHSGDCSSRLCDGTSALSGPVKANHQTKVCVLIDVENPKLATVPFKICLQNRRSLSVINKIDNKTKDQRVFTLPGQFLHLSVASFPLWLEMFCNAIQTETVDRFLSTKRNVLSLVVRRLTP